MGRRLKLQHRMLIDRVKICQMRRYRLALVGGYFAPKPTVPQQSLHRYGVKRRQHAVVFPIQDRPVCPRLGVGGIRVLHKIRIKRGLNKCLHDAQEYRPLWCLQAGRCKLPP